MLSWHFSIRCNLSKVLATMPQHLWDLPKTLSQIFDEEGADWGVDDLQGYRIIRSQCLHRREKSEVCFTTTLRLDLDYRNDPHASEASRDNVFTLEDPNVLFLLAISTDHRFILEIHVWGVPKQSLQVVSEQLVGGSVHEIAMNISKTNPATTAPRLFQHHHTHLCAAAPSEHLPIEKRTTFTLGWRLTTTRFASWLLASIELILLIIQQKLAPELSFNTTVCRQFVEQST